MCDPRKTSWQYKSKSYPLIINPYTRTFQSWSCLTIKDTVCAVYRSYPIRISYSRYLRGVFGTLTGTQVSSMFFFIVQLVISKLLHTATHRCGCLLHYYYYYILVRLTVGHVSPPKETVCAMHHACPIRIRDLGRLLKVFCTWFYNGVFPMFKQVIICKLLHTIAMDSLEQAMRI